MITPRNERDPMTTMREDAHRSCPLCGQTAILVLHARDVNRRTTDEVFSYYRCIRCFLVFVSPIPPEPGRYYPSEYYPVPSSLDQLEAEAASERYKVEYVKRFVNSGRLLDIGAGYGRFVYLAHQAGYEVDAIEIDGKCCEFITNVIGTRAMAHPQPDVALAGLEPYDVITAWHVLEHLTDPRAALKAAVQNLRAGGWLIVAMPNPESLQFRVFGHCWAHLDAPRHLQLLPPNLLIHEVTSDGRMRFVEATATDRGSLDYNYLGWTWSMRHALRVRGAWRVGAILARTLARCEQAGMRGSCYTAAFQKPG